MGARRQDGGLSCARLMHVMLRGPKDHINISHVLVPKPNRREIPEIMVGRIPMLIWPFGAPIPGSSGDLASRLGNGPYAPCHGFCCSCPDRIIQVAE